MEGYVPKFSPEMTPEFVPAPSASRVLTATNSTCLATPKVAPPTVPATWLPCPFSSVSTVLTKFAPQVARPPYSYCPISPVPLSPKPRHPMKPTSCVRRIPVSTIYATIPAPAVLSKIYPDSPAAACDMRLSPAGAAGCDTRVLILTFVSASMYET